MSSVTAYYQNVHNYPLKLSEPRGSFKEVNPQEWFEDDSGWYDRYTKGKFAQLVRLPRPPVQHTGPVRIMPVYPEKFREEQLRSKSRADLMQVCRDVGVDLKPNMSKSELINVLLMRGAG